MRTRSPISTVHSIMSVISDTIGMFEDIDGALRLIHQLCDPSTRIVIAHYSHLWEPLLKTAEAAGLRRKQPTINYIATADFLNLMDLADFEVINRERRRNLIVNSKMNDLGIRLFKLSAHTSCFPDSRQPSSGWSTELIGMRRHQPVTRII